MQVTGYRIRRVLKSLEMKRDALLDQFNDSLTKFPDEKKEHPTELMGRLGELEDKIAKLQTAQAEYNLKVEVDVLGRKMSLTHAVKRAGAAGRTANLWKTAAKVSPDRNSYRPEVRRQDEVHLARVLSPSEATDLAIGAEKFAQALRGAIAEGNSTTVEIASLDPELLTE